jgi:hypothetical protein
MSVAVQHDALAQKKAPFNEAQALQDAQKEGIPNKDIPAYLNIRREMYELKLNQQNHPQSIAPIPMHPLSVGPLTNGTFTTPAGNGFGGWAGDTSLNSVGGCPIGSGLPIPGQCPSLPYSDTYYNITRVSSGNDAIVGFPVVPTGASYAAKIGKDVNLWHTDQLSQTFIVTAATSNFTFQYALVLQDPGHPDCENPFFIARILRGSTTIVSFSEIADHTNPFFSDTIDPYGNTVVYKDWTCQSFDLSAYMYDTVTVEFIAADCAAGAHWGYAYVANVGVACSSNQEGINNIDSTQTPYGVRDTTTVALNPCTDSMIVYGNYVLPVLTGATISLNNIKWTVYHNAIATVLSGEVVPPANINTVASTYWFTITNGDLAMLTPGNGYDIVTTAEFLVNGTPDYQSSSTPGNGIIPGTNNDFTLDSLSSLCITKYDDLNGNGTRDPGEPTLAGWTYTVKDGIHTYTGTTDSSGVVCFQCISPGTDTVTETPQFGWETTSPSTLGTQIVKVGVGQDVNLLFGNKQISIDSCFGVADSFPCPWKIPYTSPQFQQYLSAQAIAGSGGVIEFGEIPGGAPCDSVTPPNLGFFGITFNFPVSSCIHDAQLRFHAKASPIGIPSTDNVDFYFFSGSGNTPTFSCGSRLIHIQPGNSTTAAVNPTGWTFGQQADFVIDLGNLSSGFNVPTHSILNQLQNGQLNVMISNNSGIDSMCLAIDTAACGSLCGKKWNDANGNGVFDKTESGIGGWTIYLKQGGVIIATMVTESDGSYCFDHVAPGTYQVVEATNFNYWQTWPASPGYYTVTVNPGQCIADLNFGNRYCWFIVYTGAVPVNNSAPALTIAPGDTVPQPISMPIKISRSTDLGSTWKVVYIGWYCPCCDPVPVPFPGPGTYSVKRLAVDGYAFTGLYVNDTLAANPTADSVNVYLADSLHGPSVLFVDQFIGNEATAFRTFTASELAQSNQAKPTSIKKGMQFSANTADILTEVLPKGGAGLIVGKAGQILPGGKTKGYLQILTQAAAFATFYGKGLTQNGSPGGIDFFSGKDKRILGLQKTLSPTVFSDALLGEMLALKINIAASDAGITPVGFGDLTVDATMMTSDFRYIAQTSTIRVLADTIDNMMTNWEGIPVDAFQNVYDIVYSIDSAFAKPLPLIAYDTLSWLRGKTLDLSLRGVNELQNVPFLSKVGNKNLAKNHLAAGTAQNRPTAYVLYQNYPNPFNPVTTLNYDLPLDSRVTLTVYNTLGQVVRVLVDQVESAGNRAVSWDASSVASGIYFYRLDATAVSNPAQHFSQVRKMALIK